MEEFRAAVEARMSKTNYRPIAVLSLAMIFVVGPMLAKAEAAVEKNVVYGMYSGLALLMDIYRPVTPNGLGLIVIPGSGWEAPLGYDASQLKESWEVTDIFGMERLLAAGYTAFVINHRATPRFEYPAPIEDAQRAVRYIRHHASDFGINPTRIGAVGGSSGGHLVSLLGTLDDLGSPSSSDPVNRHSAKVQAVVAVYPAIDFLSFSTSSPWAGGAITSLLGPVNPAWKPPQLHDADAKTLYRQASPMSYLSADDPPFLLIHGDADQVVPYSQSELFHAGLEETGVPVRLVRIPGGDHGPGLVLEDGPDHVADIIGWLDQHLKN